MYNLYFSPGACSMSVHISLEESGAPYKSQKVDLAAKKLENGANFFEINPKGQVPALQIEEGKTLTECAAILQYIADTHPEKNLLPKHGTWERHKANEWLTYVSSEVHKGMGALFAAGRMVTHPEGQAEYRNSLTSAMEKRFELLSNHLKTNTYLLGSQFSVVDAYLFTILSWHAWLKIDLTKWPILLGYMEKVKSRPSVQNALKSEGLI